MFRVVLSCNFTQIKSYFYLLRQNGKNDFNVFINCIFRSGRNKNKYVASYKNNYQGVTNEAKKIGRSIQKAVAQGMMVGLLRAFGKSSREIPRRFWCGQQSQGKTVDLDRSKRFEHSFLCSQLLPLDCFENVLAYGHRFSI